MLHETASELICGAEIVGRHCIDESIVARSISQVASFPSLPRSAFPSVLLRWEVRLL